VSTEKAHGHEIKVFKGWKQVSPGTMTPLQYDQAVGRPRGLPVVDGRAGPDHRVRVGAWVLIFLTLLTFLVWRLNAAFWKNVH
jgi:ubiquinol-cytochrome c reductase cytochrome c1 subunit